MGLTVLLFNMGSFLMTSPFISAAILLRDKRLPLAGNHYCATSHNQRHRYNRFFPSAHAPKKSLIGLLALSFVPLIPLLSILGPTLAPSRQMSGLAF
jgi:hypothetical protein